MAEKISVQIALEGVEEVKSDLAGISQAGQKCFEDISNAAAKAGGFDKLDPTLVTQKFQQFGITAKGEIDKITGAIQTAGKFEGLVTGVENVERTFKSASTTVGTFGNIASGVFSSINSAVSRLGRNFSSMLGPIGGAVRALGPFGLAAGAIGGASIALVKFSIAAEETEKTLNDLQKVTGQSFQNLSAMTDVFQQGGTSAKQFATEMGNLSEKIAAAGQAAKIRDADEATLKWANDIDAVRQKFNNLANGATVTFSALTTLDVKVKALLESLAKVGVQDQFNKLADIFKNLSSDLERAQLGKALGLSPETIQRLSLGSKVLQQMAADTIKLGLVLDDVDKKNLAKLVDAGNQARGIFTDLKDKMGALVAPALTTFWDGFKNRIKELIPTFTELASQFGKLDFSTLGRLAADFLVTLGKIAVGWANIISGKTSFSDVIAAAFKSAGSTLVNVATTLGVALGEGIVAGIVSAIRQGISAVSAAIVEFVTSLPGNIWDAFATGAATAWQTVIDWVRQGKEAVLDFVTNLPADIWDAITTAAANAWQTIIDWVRQGKQAVLDFVVNLPANIWDAFVAAGVAAWNAIIGKINDATNAVLRFIGLKPQAPSSADTGLEPSGLNGGFAGGGLLVGRGTGTSDSNLIWASRGEHVMPARVVAQPGVLDLLEALRLSGGNLRRVLDGMGRFAFGGLVRPMPAFAAGGVTGAGMSHVTIQFPGVAPISGLRASADTVAELQRAAAMAQVRSGGRKPSRYS